MDLMTLFVLALGLSMDAFAVSISNTMCFSGLRRSQCAAASLSFGLFQGLMPTIGFFAGRAFAGVISSVDHWVAFFCWASSAETWCGRPCRKCVSRPSAPCSGTTPSG